MPSETRSPSATESMCELQLSTPVKTISSKVASGADSDTDKSSLESRETPRDSFYSIASSSMSFTGWTENAQN